jgi:hypothetical protein
MARMGLACVVMAYIGMAYAVVTYKVMVYIAMTNIVMADQGLLSLARTVSWEGSRGTA